MTRKVVFVAVKEESIQCFHNLKHLTDTLNLPYFTIRRRLKGNNSIIFNHYLIGHSTIYYKTNRKAPK